SGSGQTGKPGLRGGADVAMERTNRLSAWKKWLVQWTICLAASVGCAGFAESPGEISPYLALPDFAQKPANNPPSAIHASYPAGSAAGTAVNTKNDRDDVIAPAPPGFASPLRVTLKGPETAELGTPIAYQIAVVNNGPQAATHVRLEAGFDPGLEHETKANPVALMVGDLPAGASRTYPLALIPRQSAKLAITVFATADGDLKDRINRLLTAQAKASPLALSIKGPSKRYLGRPAVWDIDVANLSEGPLGNVLVNLTVPSELHCLNVAPGGEMTVREGGGTGVSWSINYLASREHRRFQVTTRCEELSAQATIEVKATSQLGAHEAHAKASLQIDGLPALHLDVVDTVDPVEIGGKTAYKITVTNQGTLAAANIRVMAEVPVAFNVLQVDGPTQGKVEAQRVGFSPLAALAPGQSASYLVEVQAREAVEGLFRVELLSDQSKEPLVAEETTTVYGASPGDNAQSGQAVTTDIATPPASGARLNGRPDRFRDRFQKRE
ncbi:MAG: hypothetical protein ACJ8FY_25665, partial [Gemmataceae bacterium]